MGEPGKINKWKAFKKSVWREYIEVIIIAFLLVFGFMRPFVIEAFSIPSESMENTLLVGDRILVAKFMYGIKAPFTDLRILDFQEPQIGDVFVFSPPPMAGRHTLVKRVVGVPGDVIGIRDGEFYRNGLPVVYEPYIKRNQNSPLRHQDFGPVKVPQEHVFAMGDNRDNSNDSRFWGFVPYDNIKGKVFFRYWSWDKDADWLHKIRFERIGRVIE